jgi:hypothetical protein
LPIGTFFEFKFYLPFSKKNSAPAHARCGQWQAAERRLGRGCPVSPTNLRSVAGILSEAQTQRLYPLLGNQPAEAELLLNKMVCRDEELVEIP